MVIQRTSNTSNTSNTRKRINRQTMVEKTKDRNTNPIKTGVNSCASEG
jgi:hypothetical protein